jgi:hypothetical protein
MNNTKKREHFQFILKNAEEVLHSKCTPSAKRQAARAAMGAKAEIENLDRLSAGQAFIHRSLAETPATPARAKPARKAKLTARDRRQIAEFQANGGRNA